MTRPRDIADSINRINSSAADATAVTIDSSENVGIGVTPEAWGSVFQPVLRVGLGGGVFGSTATNFRITSNVYYDSAYKYIANGGASQYEQDGGVHLWYTAPSGSANGALTLTERMRMDSSGNVGIGVTAPDTPLEIQRGSSGNALKLSSSTDGASVFLAFEHQESGTKHVRGRIRAASNGVEGGLIFETGASSSTSEVMRIDNSGRVFIGNANNDTNPASTGSASNKGATFGGSSDPYLSIGRTGNAAIVAGRIDSEGEIIYLYADGTTIGFLGVDFTDNLFISGNSSHSGVVFGSTAIIPYKNGNVADNSLDLGSSTGRYDDIFATNSTIQTSDQNEKQDIASLTDAEITAAKAISKLFKTFKWKDKVASKSDSARTHAGVIAQEVQSAMTDAGLNATKYAFWCSDTWWETQTEVPAVEADEENGIEAKDAYTRTDIYDTADEAPEGATEKTRLGIRYPELLAFIGAATEQRLTSIEARLTALENE